MAMFDNGDRAKATELRMIEKYARAAFKAGWISRDAIGPFNKPASTADEQFDNWWKEAQ
jgi:hypothetical protein